MILRSGVCSGVEQRVLDELLGDRAGAAERSRGRGRSGRARAGCARTSKPGLLVEVGVLGGDGRVAQGCGISVERHDGAPAALGIVELAEQRAVAIEDARGLEDAPAVKLGVVGQISGVIGVEPTTPTNASDATNAMRSAVQRKKRMQSGPARSWRQRIVSVRRRTPAHNSTPRFQAMSPEPGTCNLELARGPACYKT